MSRLLSAVLALVAAAAVLTSCASSAQTGVKGGAGGGAGSGASGGSHHVVAGESDNGKTITLAKGDTLVLRLHNTYWTIQTPSGGTLQLENRSTHTVPMGPRACVPGGGCGTVGAKFTAERAGRTEVQASRTTCGEALRCVGSTGHYRLTVVVH